jgi:hypothetical protein
MESTQFEKAYEDFSYQAFYVEKLNRVKYLDLRGLVMSSKVSTGTKGQNPTSDRIWTHGRAFQGVQTTEST